MLLEIQILCLDLGPNSFIKHNIHNKRSLCKDFFFGIVNSKHTTQKIWYTTCVFQISGSDYNVFCNYLIIMLTIIYVSFKFYFLEVINQNRIRSQKTIVQLVKLIGIFNNERRNVCLIESFVSHFSKRKFENEIIVGDTVPIIIETPVFLSTPIYQR